MSKHSQITPGPDDEGPRRVAMPSLLERAANVYDFGAHIRTPAQSAVPMAGPSIRPVVRDGSEQLGRPGTVSVENLTAGGFIVPGAAPTPLAEEMRIVKRQLLAGVEAVAHGNTILVCSARPDEGKTFCAINLALSLAAEKDMRVVLVDADVIKPDIVRLLGLDDGPGLLDAIADPVVDVEACLIHTDVARLSVLPSGAAAHDATELLASARTRVVLDRLRGVDARRVIVFDSPPVLAASPAGVLAMHSGQAVFVVRAERTAEADIREAIGLVSACPRPQLLLNGVEFGGAARRFGRYYGPEE